MKCSFFQLECNRGTPQYLHWHPVPLLGRIRYHTWISQGGAQILYITYLHITAILLHITAISFLISQIKEKIFSYITSQDLHDSPRPPHFGKFSKLGIYLDLLFLVNLSLLVHLYFLQIH